VSKSIALGYVPSELAKASEQFEVEILGERRRARVAEQALHDPRAERMRAG
jgi:dimethylglycine dehydrogenase